VYYGELEVHDVRGLELADHDFIICERELGLKGFGIISDDSAKATKIKTP